MAAAAAALLIAALWHWPATAQRAPAAAASTTTASAAAATPAARPATPTRITFDEYRDFRLHSMARRQAQLQRQLAGPDLSPRQKATIEGKLAYYDRLAAMPADARDKLFRARFDRIDSDHDGTIDQAERAAWRQQQQSYYAQLAAQHPTTRNDQH